MLTTTRRSLAVTVLVVAGSTVSVAQPASATNPGSNGKIAYIRNDTAPSNIGTQPCLGDALWIMDANGTNQHPLTAAHPDYALGDPAFSPNGRYIAYPYTLRSDVEDSGNPDVLTIGLWDLQSNQHRDPPVGSLTLPDYALEDAGGFCNYPYGPTWSPDGKKLAIENYYGLAVFSLSNPNDPKFLPFPSGGYDDPSWAPFGGKFAVGTGSVDMGTITTGGKNLKKLTYSGLTGNDDGNHTPEDDTDDFNPSPLSRADWSPDGENVLVSASTNGAEWRPRMGFLDTCGGPLRLVDPNPYNRNSHAGYDASWSPDGEKVVFSHTTYVPDVGEPEGREQHDIWVMDADGAGVVQLTDTPATETTAIFEDAPDWQPINPDPAPEATVCPGQGVTIEGRVLDGRAPDRHSNPLAGVVVSLRQDGDEVMDPITTEDDGSYSFEDVPEGTYQLRATLSYSENDEEIFDVRYKHTGSEPLWVETEIDVNAGDSPLKDIVFSSAPSARLSDVSSDVNQSGRDRLDDMANIFFRTHQYVQWAKDELGADLTSAAYPGPVEMYTFSNETEGAHYLSTSTVIHFSTDDSFFFNREDQGDEGPENDEWHEFTHHLDYVNVGNWECPGEVNHGGTGNDSSCDSFSEGAAMFFPTVADRALRSDPEDSIYSVFGSMESNGWKAWSRTQYSQGGVSKTSFDEDRAVGTLMWDLYDAEADELEKNVLNDDRSDVIPYTFRDDIEIPVRTLFDVMRALGANPTIFDYWQALHSSPQITSSYKAITVDLDGDTTPDVAPLDVPFLMHGFYPLAYADPTIYLTYDPDIADDLSVPGTARNRVVGRTDRPVKHGNDPITYGPREHIHLIPTAQVRMDVTDQADEFVSGATAKLKINYPEGPQTIKVTLQDGKGDLVPLALPPPDPSDFFTHGESECEVVSEDTIKVSVTVSKSGEQSKETKKFNSCSYSDALLSPHGNAALDYDFTVKRDRSTTTSLGVEKTNSKVVASGEVKPGHPGKKVEVALLRNQGGSLVVRDEKKALLNSKSKYSIDFARLPSGSCRIDARFPGDDDHDSSKKSATFSC